MRTIETRYVRRLFALLHELTNRIRTLEARITDLEEWVEELGHDVQERES